MKTNKPKDMSTMLFKRQPFFKAMGSVLNIYPNNYKLRQTGKGLEDDAKAIKSDWSVVGQDIRNAIKKTR